MLGKNEDMLAIRIDKWIVKAEDNKDKLEFLYMEFRKPIFLLALSIVRDYQMAEDIMQETFLKVMKNSESYKEMGNAKAWIMTITRNISLNYLKKSKREEAKEEFVIESEDNFTEDVEGTMEFFRIIQDLNEEERQIIALKLLGGLGYIQIAKILKISLVSARKKYSRAIKKLRVSMD